jgi:hypothetical protein
MRDDDPCKIDIRRAVFGVGVPVGHALYGAPRTELQNARRMTTLFERIPSWCRGACPGRAVRRRLVVRDAHPDEGGDRRTPAPDRLRSGSRRWTS